MGAFLLHRFPQRASEVPDQLPRQLGELGKRRIPHVMSLNDALRRILEIRKLRGDASGQGASFFVGQSGKGVCFAGQA